MNQKENTIKKELLEGVKATILASIELPAELQSQERGACIKAYANGWKAAQAENSLMHLHYKRVSYSPQLPYKTLRYVIATYGYNVKQLAGLVGVDYSTFAKQLCGKSRIKIETAYKVLEVLGLPEFALTFLFPKDIYKKAESPAEFVVSFLEEVSA